MLDFNGTTPQFFHRADVLLDRAADTIMSHPYTASLTDLLPSFVHQYNPQPLFKQKWEDMCNNYSEYHIATYGSLAVQVIFYFGCAFPGFVFQFFNFMKSLKVQQNKAHTLKEQWICLRRVFFSKSCIYLPLIIALFYVVNFLNLIVPYDYASMPTWYAMIPRMIFCLMCEDTWHYWMHRVLHIKAIYGPVHKLHHQFNIPFGLAAEYAHPLETIILGIGFFIPLVFVCNHLFVFWCWLAVRMLQTTDVHSGFYFPWLNPLYLLPFYGGVRFHDFHHYYFNANYASTFTFWDWICGTDGPYYEYEKKRMEKEKQAKLEQNNGKKSS